MYNNKEHGNNINNKRSAQNTGVHQVILNKSDKINCKLYKGMQEAK
jgi:hypothetical protein